MTYRPKKVSVFSKTTKKEYHRRLVDAADMLKTGLYTSNQLNSDGSFVKSVQTAPVETMRDVSTMMTKELSLLHNEEGEPIDGFKKLNLADQRVAMMEYQRTGKVLMKEESL